MILCIFLIKGLVTHPQSMLGVHFFPDESNRSYIKTCPGPSKPYNEVSGSFLSTVQKT